MAKRKWTLECAVCGKQETADDEIEIRQLKWSILAWVVETAMPRCVCSKCDYFAKKNFKRK